MSTYKHDCDKCVFLGTLTMAPQYTPHDLYYCAQSFMPGRPTVIARFGDRGDMYTSGMCFADGVDTALTVAKVLAKQRSLI